MAARSIRSAISSGFSRLLRRVTSPCRTRPLGKGDTVGPLVLVLLLILVLAAAGFALKLLWIIALVLLALWLIGFVVRSAEGARWYRW